MSGGDEPAGACGAQGPDAAVVVDRRLAEGDLAGALDVVRAMRADGPDDVGLGSLETVLCLALGDLEGADRVATSLVRTWPDEPASWLSVARVGLAEDDQRRVLASAEQALERAPGDISVLLLAARAAARSGDDASARRFRDDALRVGGDRPDVLETAGVVDLMARRWSDAQTWLRASIAVGGPTPQRLVRLADALRLAGDLDGAEEVLLGASGPDDSQPVVVSQVGLGLVAQQRVVLASLPFGVAAVGLLVASELRPEVGWLSALGWLAFAAWVVTGVVAYRSLPERSRRAFRHVQRPSATRPSPVPRGPSAPPRVSNRVLGLAVALALGVAVVLALLIFYPPATGGR